MRPLLALLLLLWSTPLLAQVASPPEFLGSIAGPGSVVEPAGVRFYGTDLGWTFEHKGQHLMLFGDNPSGEIFYLNADKLPNGGQDQLRRIMFDDPSTSSGSPRAESRGDKATNKTLLQLIREKNAAQGKPPAPRADLRLGRGAGNQIFIMNKRDGVIRVFVP